MYEKRFRIFLHEIWAHRLKYWQQSEELVCRLQNMAMHDYQESVTTGQTDRYIDRQAPDKVIP